jgi:hypothetical protein
VAPNLGRAAGLGPIASLAVPFAMIAAVAALCVAPLGRIRPPATLAAGLGLLVFLATLVPTPALDPAFEEWRAKLTQYLVSLPRD